MHSLDCMENIQSIFAAWNVDPMAGASAAFVCREVASDTEAVHGRTMRWKKLGYLTFICLPACLPQYPSVGESNESLP